MKMARRAFYSFHYRPDHWRASQVRNMGVIEGNAPVSDNDWEAVTETGDGGIKKWIDNQLQGRSCTIVLIGAETAGRKYINYEIDQSWNSKKGLVGVHIHRLKDADKMQATLGGNPFGGFNIKGKALTSIVRTYNPPYADSKDAYDYIKTNLESWVDEAISIREQYS